MVKVIVSNRGKGSVADDVGLLFSGVENAEVNMKEQIDGSLYEIIFSIAVCFSLKEILQFPINLYKNIPCLSMDCV